ncbi:hypothetical protein [Salana multivorans]
MNQLGIVARASRNTPLLHLASTTPRAAFASLIGIHINTATRWAELHRLILEQLRCSPALTRTARSSGNVGGHS